MGKSPAFKFYAADFDTDTASWTCEQVGAYLRLLMYEWINGALPESNAQRARIIRIDPRSMQKMWSTVLAKKFTMNHANMYVNPRLEEERSKQEEYRKKQSELGKLGAKVKLKNSKKKEDNMPRVALRVADRVAGVNPSRVLQAVQYSYISIDTLSSLEGIGGPKIFNEFFKLFPGQKTIQTFDDSATNPKLARIFHFTDEMPLTMATELQYLNDHRAGIYFTVNETDGKGRKADNIVRIRSVFADMDGAPLFPAIQYDPSLMIESSPERYHCYWFVDDLVLEAFSPIQKNIARILGSDPKVHDLPRVMRVPGFYHQKGEPFMSKVIGGSGKIFTHLQLTEMFPPEKVSTWSAKRYQIDKPSHFTGDFKGSYGASNGDRNWHCFRRACGMFKRGLSRPEVESETLKEALACNPPLSEHETMTIVKSAARYF
jgi:uncharacterized protein YdaU (DUF1376 family)